MSFVTIPCTKCGSKLKIRELYARNQTEIRCVKCGAKIAITQDPHGGKPSATPTPPAPLPLDARPPVAPAPAAPLPVVPLAEPVKPAAVLPLPPAAAVENALPTVVSHRLMLIKPSSGPIVAPATPPHLPVVPVPLPPAAVHMAVPVVPKVIAVHPPAPETAPRPPPSVTPIQPAPMVVELQARVVKLEGEVQALREMLNKRPAEVEALNQKTMDGLGADINDTINLWKQELLDASKLELNRAESLVKVLQARIQHLQD